MTTLAQRVANAPNFDILARAAADAGLDRALANPASRLTLFAPTDQAFGRFAEALGFRDDASDETAVYAFIVDRLTRLSPDGDPATLLGHILRYHLLGDERTVAELEQAGRARALNGEVLGFEDRRVEDRDDDTEDAAIGIADRRLDNGLFNAVDEVLAPFDIPETDRSGEIDVAVGDFRNELIRTGAGDDIVIARFGDDTVGGGSGDDSIDAGGGDDVVFGGSGKDALFGRSGADGAFGGAGNDVVDGGTGDDRLFGQADKDDLEGGAGRDLLNGGAGDDTLSGGAANDALTGATGSDRFVFAPGGGVDRVRDYDDGEDEIDLKRFDRFDEFDDLDVEEVGDRVVIDLGGGDRIVLVGVDGDDLGDEDFRFRDEGPLDNLFG